jgi:broad specificity phosphatase PhoE
LATTIYLVRHGQTRSNATRYIMGYSDEDLDETGLQQVHRLSSRLANVPLDAVYTSPLQRALSTAEKIAAPHGLEPQIEQELIEINVGDWQGLHADEIRRRWPDLWQQSRIDPSDITLPHGESYPQVSQRVVRAFNRLAGLNREQRALIVTHDIVIRLIVAYVLGVSNNIYRRIEINNASLTRVRIEGGNPKLITLNDTAHLE